VGRCIDAVMANCGIDLNQIEILAEQDSQRIGAPKMVKNLTDKSHGQMVCFLGDDCIPQKDWLKYALMAMETLPDGWGLVGLDDNIRKPGTIKAAEPPIVIITTNRTREIHDALKRRCLYHWVDYPNAAQELEIIRRKVPGCNAALSQQVVAYVQKLRTLDLFKSPGVAETIDWATALTELDRIALDPETIADTLGTLLKYQDDIARLQGGEGERVLSEVKADLRVAG